MSTLKAMWNCLFSPRLIKVYGDGSIERVYKPNRLEKLGDQVLYSLYIMWKLGVYTSPFLVGILYKKGYLQSEGLVTLTRFVTSLGVILVVSFCMRSFGRAANPVYTKFVETLKDANERLTPSVKHNLLKYDFEFYAWPIEFRWNDVESDSSKQSIFPERANYRNPLQFLASIPLHVIGYVAVHTFGIKLIYPGSVGALQMAIDQSIVQGRTKLTEVNKGQRFKLLARDNNEIDSMFIDRRNQTQNGHILVICSEGNAGFYEIGIMGTPIDAGYSVLGWNHPGFGGSTGTPYPKQEHNAMDVVIQFAIHKLGFKPENILLFGWSIGGYTSTWAAMNYPEIKGIILDASFDDILPIAIRFMPAWWETIVKFAIRQYVNLNNIEQLNKYPGPVLIVRRTEDEVICLNEGDISTNRGNDLLIKLLRYRFPLVVGDTQVQVIRDYLSNSSSKQDRILQEQNINSDLCRSLLESYISEHSKSYPMRIGEGMAELQKNHMVLYLIKKYMKDYKSSHCTPLPVDMFQIPWDINIETDYVFT